MRAQLHEFQRLLDALMHLRGRALDRFLIEQRIRNVVLDVHRVEQCALLEQHADAAADLEEFLLLHAADVLAEDEDLARIGPHQPQRGFQQHGLPAAGRAQDHARFAFVGFERQVAQCFHAVKRDVDVFETQNRRFTAWAPFKRPG